jgi:hypothetical protein
MLQYAGAPADNADAFDLTNVQYCAVSNNTLMKTIAGVAGWRAHGLPATMGAPFVGAGKAFIVKADEINNFVI